jgi:ficolin
MGLEHLHQLTSLETWKLAVKMKYKDGSFGYSVWNNFKVDGESNKYMMHLGGVIQQHNVRGDVWQTLLKNPTNESDGSWNGLKFTTTDSDNDNYDGDCATEFGGGWWFNTCYAICLNCAIPDGDEDIVETLMAIQKGY